MLTDPNCASGAEDLITWMTSESLCCEFETNIRFYISGTSTKEKKSISFLYPNEYMEINTVFTVAHIKKSCLRVCLTKHV